MEKIQIGNWVFIPKKWNTKWTKHYYSDYKNSHYYSIYEAYNKPSYWKVEAWNNFINEIEPFVEHKCFKVINHNGFRFTIGAVITYHGKDYFLVITQWNAYCSEIK